MQKKLIFAMLLLFCTFHASFATSYEGVAIQVITPKLINISDSESYALSGIVQAKLKSNLQDYLGVITTVDVEAEKQIIDLQRKSESASRSEEDILEAGKIVTAKYAIFTTIIKTNKKYSISCDFTDLTTGVQLASVISKNYDNSEKLFTDTGAIDDITFNLCQKLNIHLTATQEYILQHGRYELSVEEQLEEARLLEENYYKQIAELDKQIENLSTSTSLDSIEARKMAEAQKNLILERQKTAKLRADELLKQKELKEADSQKEALRNSELKQKRDELASQAEKKAKQVRQLKTNNLSVYDKINLIENKKKAYLEIRDNVDAEIVELEKQRQNDIEIRTLELQNQPWRRAQLDENGNPTPFEQSLRNKEIKKETDEISKKYDERILSVKNSVAKQQADLLASINNDRKQLNKENKINSLNPDLQVNYGPWNTLKGGWNAYLYYYSEGILLFQNTFFLSYENLTSKKIPTSTSSQQERNEFYDTVDIYDSLLMRNVPILIYELSYNVQALDENHPSQYKFTINSLEVTDTSNNKKLQSPTLTNTYLVRTWNPIYDLRSSQKIYTAEQSNQIDSSTSTTHNHNSQTKNNSYSSQKKRHNEFAFNLDWKFNNFGTIFGLSMDYRKYFGNYFFTDTYFAYYYDSKNSYDFCIDFAGKTGIKANNIFLDCGLGFTTNNLSQPGFMLLGEIGAQWLFFEISYNLEYVVSNYWTDHVKLGIVLDF